MDINSFIHDLTSIVGSQGIITNPKDTEIYNTDWRQIFQGNSIAVLRPQNTQEVSDVVKLCVQYDVTIIPQGGNTSLVGGATPPKQGNQIILSLSRMNKIRNIDTIDSTMTVEAGVILEEAQNAAKNAGLYLPIVIASQGSAQIGGVIATNAGGNNTLRYGNAREFVLGLEVVTADGQILHNLRRLRKDNTGYALKQIFIGSEGTLGIITAAVLHLHPLPRSTEVALCAVPDLQHALRLLHLFNNYNPAALQAFEYISQKGMDLVCQHFPELNFPLETKAPVYIVVELAIPAQGDGLRELFETVLEKAFEEEIILDAVLAESETQRLNLWRFREEQSESQKLSGANIKNDVSVPISSIPEFIERATQACEAIYPGIQVAPFGHLGDGNIHFNLVQPANGDSKDFMNKSHDLMDAVCAVVYDLEGSFSAEHGIGQLKNYMMPSWRGGVELELMEKIKQSLDPKNILNPGKIFPN
ncbi:FAD/FMN-containing lactate dehydrogenase/glycolate oxidase (GlcD) (PDB:1AHU) [Commensalibacter communis]|uniref:FAD/FMN-containing lactate dehydrogenase/glycolate oxidase (GlcD) n=1 Tax=Commensalibacter communis TaxID=2972786 RepID=A0A9W4XGW1_9PROT|nr:FAD-binding oxidoreductase [Commensalibacter communis]CAI3924353.1 FAD/FMN-containing lactate dehydrogenase/glycolate oxidase (GlcD) (PDB:1AHU) [Commensalibacter communis]CAI3925830.1 FAD/FMN-containing lactate dehydrogenase/glycolate oxidase (GlcD) (PDB:1AHU) [Commensalibacter communis]CAI3936609.1 FAD/FMN-containing lactate dehydrogenase/glycolate oxidase (GlcD) (PDB:1AHU) [Commensalibacter communis]CAI3937152.1 FAD/FMN-containing lactate dehydrogenase/glycolate oxidase (GlcD) (PDB:1AHU) [